MPEMRFRIRWPDGERETCYSPSLVIKEYLSPGATYAVDDFVSRSREALEIASERVRAKFGRPCSLALNQLGRIEAASARFAGTTNSGVMVEAFEE